jgi:hypothetical protein
MTSDSSGDSEKPYGHLSVAIGRAGPRRLPERSGGQANLD